MYSAMWLLHSAGGRDRNTPPATAAEPALLALWLVLPLPLPGNDSRGAATEPSSLKEVKEPSSSQESILT